MLHDLNQLQGNEDHKTENSMGQWLLMDYRLL